MRKFVAITKTDLPKHISLNVIDTWFGYTVWLDDVLKAERDSITEVVKFKQLKKDGVCDKVEEVSSTLNQMVTLRIFMETNGLDVIFEDLEAEE
jgi:hypothetical protein